jgi:RNA recognition motif-containing protein
MSKKLYVGNLPYSANDHSLMTAFAECGSVQSAKVITDRETGRSKGFAFVEMSTDAEATSAIERFNGADWDGRAMNVSEAKPQAPRTNTRDGYSSRGSY